MSALEPKVSVNRFSPLANSRIGIKRRLVAGFVVIRHNERLVRASSNLNLVLKFVGDRQILAASSGFASVRITTPT